MKISHFIGFRGDEYHSAVKAFGPPHFIHIRHDPRANREIDWDRDLVIFANKEREDHVHKHNGPDIIEPDGGFL